MVEEWPDVVSVDEMYGDWDYEAAVEVLGRSLDPRPSMSLFDTIGAGSSAKGPRGERVECLRCRTSCRVAPRTPLWPFVLPPRVPRE